MIPFCAPVMLTISYSLVIPPAYHLFNRKQINSLFLYVTKTLIPWTTQNQRELERTVNPKSYYKALINITAAPRDPSRERSPLFSALP